MGKTNYKANKPPARVQRGDYVIVRSQLLLSKFMLELMNSLPSFSLERCVSTTQTLITGQLTAIRLACALGQRQEAPKAPHTSAS